MRKDKYGNLEFLDDGSTNPEFKADQLADEPGAGGNTNKETEEMINRLVEERLSKVKQNLDKAYAERDAAVRERVRLEDEAKQRKIQELENDGKHKEVAEMKLAELQEKLAIASSRVTELTRDAAVRDALSGLDFRNDRSSLMAYRDIVDQLTQDPETGAWIHRSGVSIKDFVSQFAKNEENSFLFKVKNNSGGGSGTPGGTPKLDPNKKISEMTTDEMLAAAAAGKLGNFSL
jgi:hypothetical protein